MSAWGSIATEMDIPRHVRFTPGSDRIADIPDWQLRAKLRHPHLLYLMVSSADHDIIIATC
jgi:hypothetical protein